MLLTLSPCGTMLISETQGRRHTLYINELTIQHTVNTKKIPWITYLFSR